MGDKIPLMNTEQTERLFYNERKGQSAIEYLMTYGWMLLVVAIVGGAIFATVQGQCTQSSSGFTGQDIQVAQFGVTSGDTLQSELQNAGASRINVTGLTLTNTDTGESIVYDSSNITDATTDGTEIDVGNSNVFELSPVTSTDGCNTFDLTINYDQGNLNNQQITGTLTDTMELA